MFGLAERDLLPRLRCHACTLRCNFAAGEEDLQAIQLGHKISVPASSVGLAFQRPQLAAHLAQQVLHAQQAGFGGVETAFGLLLAPPILQHSGGFLDDRSAVLGAGVEHRVDLALAHDHVLLATDTGIAEQLLDVQQAAVDAVDRVLALARAEQSATDCHLRELDRQQTRRVVQRQHHLGAPECRSLGRTGEDDVVHLLATHGTRRLRAQHPGNGVHHVGLARTVGADDDGDPRLELQGGGVGERLETFEGERLQEHGVGDPNGRSPPPPTASPRSLRKRCRGWCRVCEP